MLYTSRYFKMCRWLIYLRKRGRLMYIISLLRGEERCVMILKTIVKETSTLCTGRKNIVA